MGQVLERVCPGDSVDDEFGYMVEKNECVFDLFPFEMAFEVLMYLDFTNEVLVFVELSPKQTRRFDNEKVWQRLFDLRVGGLQSPLENTNKDRYLDKLYSLHSVNQYNPSNDIYWLDRLICCRNYILADHYIRLMKNQHLVLQHLYRDGRDHVYRYLLEKATWEYNPLINIPIEYIALTPESYDLFILTVKKIGIPPKFISRARKAKRHDLVKLSKPYIIHKS